VPVDDGRNLLLGGPDGSLRLWRHPGVHAAFLKQLDQAEQSLKAGRYESAIPQYSLALALYPEPAVRQALEDAKAARLKAMHDERDRLKSLSHAAPTPGS
jgi:hypothetical protein